MPERIMPGLGLRAFYDPGQRNWGTSVSEDLRVLSVLVQARALSRGTALPGIGSVGDVYIVPAGDPTNANALALWDGEAGAEDWVFLTPQEGWQVWVSDEARHLRFTGGAWVEVPRPGIVPIRTLTATAHTLELTDTGHILETTGSSGVTITIPPEAAVPFEIGTLINVTQVGTGVATVQADTGVSLNGVTGGSVALDGPWSGAALVKRGADAWVIQGAHESADDARGQPRDSGARSRGTELIAGWFDHCRDAKRLRRAARSDTQLQQMKRSASIVCRSYSTTG
ncbi:MAG: DUF2793 domain-containing protein [Roseovarius sp.]|nr:DUF2793 domain-containing protein [Roseovarius sp.]